MITFPLFVIMTLLGPSDEQKEIITGLASHHVIVDAVAGSGKTTASLHIANTHPTQKILLITYNARLKLETRNRVALYNILNLEIHSYHSFGYHYYNICCMNDSGIAQTIEEGFLPTNKYYYDIVILDELQDMSFLYYKFVHKIINDMCLKPKLCLLGDIYQNIYSFNNADSRFLSMADHIFASGTWLKLALSMSFRLTDPMGIFVNTHVFKTDRIKTNKPGERIRYIICDAFKQTPYYELIFYLKRFKPEEIFVLAPSVRKGPRCSPIRVLANKMSKKGIPVYVPNSDEDKLDDEILKGKLCFSTFHQVKGLERKVVIVYSFDDSYYIYYNRDANKETCPNELYVAITRATECLSLIHHYQNDYLPFLDIKKLKETVWLQPFYRVKVLHKRNAKSNMGVGDMTKHLPTEVMQKIYDCLKFKRICAREKYINIPFKVKQRDGLMENVSDITGVAIPAYYEWLKMRQINN